MPERKVTVTFFQPLLQCPEQGTINQHRNCHTTVMGSSKEIQTSMKQNVAMKIIVFERMRTKRVKIEQTTYQTTLILIK